MISTIARTPDGATITLDSSVLTIEVGGPGSRFMKQLLLTNLSDTNDVMLSFFPSAIADDQEYTLLPGATLSLDYNKDRAFSVYVRGTSGEKVSYIAL